MSGKKRWLLRVGLVTLASSLVLAAAPASHAGAGDVILPALPAREVFTEAQFQQAKGFREAASAHYAKGRLGKALQAATDAFEAYPNASTCLLRAVILGEMKRAREAFEAYLLALNLEPDEATVELILKGVATHGAATGLAVISVAPTPPEAQVTVDATALPARVSSVGVPAGQHAVHLAADGYAPADRTVDAAAGDVLRVKVALEPVAVHDGSDAAPDPLADPAPGPDAAGGGTLTTAGWALVGSGAALVVGGGVFFGLAFSDRGALSDLDPALGPVEGARQYNDLSDSMETNNTVAWVLAGLGAATLAGGIVALVLDGGDDSPDTEGSVQPAATFGLTPLPGGAAAVGSWRF